MKKLWIIGIVFLLLFSVGFSALDDGVVAYYKLDETSGTNAVDSAGSNDGTASNSRIFTSNTGTSGKINSGADFTQGDDYIDLGTGFADGTNSITINSWFKSNEIIGNTGGVSIFSKGVYSGTISRYLIAQAHDVNNEFMFDVADGTTRYTLRGSVSDIQEWNMATLVIDKDDLIRVYVNGVETQSTSWSKNNINPSGNAFIGKVDTDRFIDGFVDEVGIWDRALSASEIEELHDAQKDGFESGQYPFNAVEIFRITAKDGRTNTTLTNFTTTIQGFEFDSAIDIGIIEVANVNFYAGVADSETLPAGCYSNYPIRITQTRGTESLSTYRLNCFNYDTNAFQNFVISSSEIINATLDLNVTDAISSHLFLNDSEIITPTINFLGKEKNYNILLEQDDYFPRTYANYNISTNLDAELFRIGEVNLFIRNLNNNELITDNVTITVENTNSQQILSTTTGTALLEDLQLNNDYQIKLESTNFDTSFQTIQYNGYIESKTFFMETNGTQVSVRVQDVGGSRLSNANVVIRSYVNGSLMDIQSKFSDVNGLATFVLDTERTHLISVTKEDYTALTNLLIDFSDTNIVVILDSTLQQVIKTPYDGVTYSITPAAFSINPNQLQNFSFSISSSVYDLSQFSLTLYNASSIIAFNGSLETQGGIVTLNNINVSEMRNVKAVGAFTPVDFPQQTVTRTYFITTIERFNGSMLELRQRMASELTDIQRFVIFGLVFFITMIILSVFITGLNNIMISMTMAILFAWLIGMNMFFITAITFIVMLLLFALTLER